MRRATLIVTAGIAALALIAARAPAHDATPLTCDGKPAKFHMQRAHTIIGKAFARTRFLDATPATAAEKRAWRSHKFCLRGERRDRIGRMVDEARAAFEADYLGRLYPPGLATLAAIRQCESRGNYQAVDSSGTYFGAYQFDVQTWASVGGAGNPAAAPAREQDYRAARLYQARGAAPWPVCGR